MDRTRLPRQFGGRRHDKQERVPECKKCTHYRPKTVKEDAHCLKLNIYNPQPCDDFDFMWGWWWRNDEHVRNNG